MSVLCNLGVKYYEGKRIHKESVFFLQTYALTLLHFSLSFSLYLLLIPLWVWLQYVLCSSFISTHFLLSFFFLFKIVVNFLSFFFFLSFSVFLISYVSLSLFLLSLLHFFFLSFYLIFLSFFLLYICFFLSFFLF